MEILILEVSNFCRILCFILKFGFFFPKKIVVRIEKILENEGIYMEKRVISI